MHLLLSAISVNEAEILANSADVLDLKDPFKGPLGHPDLDIVEGVRAVIGKEQTLSVALGDLSTNQTDLSGLAMKMSAAGADIVKVALADISQRQAITSLQNINQKLAGSAKLVVCAYADAWRHGFFLPHELSQVAHRAGVSGTLLDTCVKNGETLFDVMTIQEIDKIVSESSSLGLTSALAGSLGADDIEIIAQVRPDYIGFRSAVTSNGERGTVGVDSGKALTLKMAVTAATNATMGIPG